MNIWDRERYVSSGAVRLALAHIQNYTTPLEIPESIDGPTPIPPPSSSKTPSTVKDTAKTTG
jgi:hypothetical protein